MVTFDNLADQLSSHSIDLHASELHGILTGQVCRLRKVGLRNDRLALYKRWLGVEPSSKIISMLESAYISVVDNLDEFSDFEFRLLLPVEDRPINQRVEAVTLWCNGFLDGLGTAGLSTDVIGGDVAEALSDLKNISLLDVNVPDGEDNEVDLAEIEEYVRVSVLLIFADINTRQSH